MTTVEIHSSVANALYKYPTNYIRTTKYTLLSFLPLNLIMQFSRVSNLYFLSNMTVALIPGISPVFPITSILPLLSVLIVAGGRDAFDDYQRYKSDQRANGLPVKVIDEKTGKVTKMKSQDVSVGSILLLENGDEIPADCAVLATASEDGGCYVETANLDGETNLKPKLAMKSTHDYFKNGFEKLPLDGGSRGTIMCDEPNNSLHKWEGTMEFHDRKFALDLDTLLLRGCVMKNCKWVYAVAIYTGVNTKLFLNLVNKPPKMSRLDRKLNKIVLGLLLLQQIVLFMLAYLSVQFQESSSIKGSWYIHGGEAARSADATLLRNYLTFFILLSLMMPISLFVSLEFCKTVQAKIMDWDDEMVHVNSPSDIRRTTAKTSTLNEELSQVQYIFTDKTGTLTENQMRFAKCHVLGQVYDELANPGVCARKQQEQRHEKSLRRFVRSLALNNAVVIQPNADGTMNYEGSSPDEVELVGAAQRAACALVGRSSETMTITERGQRETVELLCILPFTAERKMMSVIIRERDTKRIVVHTKGADSSVVAGLKDKSFADACGANAFLMDCSLQGLRTLVLGEKVLSEAEYNTWRNQVWDPASTSLTDRDALVHKACLSMECGLDLVGCTAIEDRLQDDVPDTIDFLLKAGITVWVLTGDKRETAVNIAGTCRLLNVRQDSIVQLDIEKKIPLLEQLVAGHQEADLAKARHHKCSCVVDGRTLESILNDKTPIAKDAKENMYTLFQKLALKVDSGVCCRVTPLQKANVVEMVQSLRYTCLSIGDGANDVSMIQEAKVGIGILGLEGSQAERASDYAIPKFRFLRRLLAVHGRYSQFRNSQLIQYSFYKNLVYSFAQIYFAFFSGFTGQTIFDGWIILLMNMIFTAAPPLVMGMFDYDVSDELCVQLPWLYKELRNPISNLRLSRITAVVWLTSSLLHGVICFYTVLAANLDPTAMSSFGLWGDGTVLMTAVMGVIITRASLAFQNWTWLHFFSVIVSHASFFAYVFVYGAVPGPFSGVGTTVYKAAISWITIALVSVIAIFPDVIIASSRKAFFPSSYHVAQRLDLATTTKPTLVDIFFSPMTPVEQTSSKSRTASKISDSSNSRGRTFSQDL